MKCQNDLRSTILPQPLCLATTSFGSSIPSVDIKRHHPILALIVYLLFPTKHFQHTHYSDKAISAEKVVLLLFFDVSAYRQPASPLPPNFARHNHVEESIEKFSIKISMKFNSLVLQKLLAG